MTLFLMAITFGTVGWCLWIRRAAWGSSWERATTVCVGMAALGSFLETPLASDSLGVWLHYLTGRYSVNGLIGMGVQTGSASALYVSVMIRTTPTQQIQQIFDRRVQWVRTLTAPLMVCCFIESPRTHRFLENWVTSDTGPWLKTLWLMFCGEMLYYMFHTAQCLHKLRRVDRASRRVAGMYLIAILCGAFGAILRIATLWNDRNIWPVMLIASFVMTSILAYASTYSWQRKLNWFLRRPLKPPTVEAPDVFPFDPREDNRGEPQPMSDP